MELIKELGEKGIWLSITTRDLYYWAKVLNKIDELMNDAIKEMQEDAKNRRTDDAFMEIEPKYKNSYIKWSKTNPVLAFRLKPNIKPLSLSTFRISANF